MKDSIMLCEVAEIPKSNWMSAFTHNDESSNLVVRLKNSIWKGSTLVCLETGGSLTYGELKNGKPISAHKVRKSPINEKFEYVLRDFRGLPYYRATITISYKVSDPRKIVEDENLQKTTTVAKNLSQFLENPLNEICETIEPTNPMEATSLVNEYLGEAKKFGKEFNNWFNGLTVVRATASIRMSEEDEQALQELNNDERTRELEKLKKTQDYEDKILDLKNEKEVKEVETDTKISKVLADNKVREIILRNIAPILDDPQKLIAWIGSEDPQELYRLQKELKEEQRQFIIDIVEKAKELDIDMDNPIAIRNFTNLLMDTNPSSNLLSNSSSRNLSEDEDNQDDAIPDD